LIGLGWAVRPARLFESNEMDGVVNSKVVGLMGGVGVDVSQFLLEVRYDVELTNVPKDTAVGYRFN